MATKQSTVDFLVEKISSAGVIRTRKMFGEYAIYCHDKVVALICDDQLFIKPTLFGRAFIGTPEEVPAYPGSKPYFLIEEDRWEDAQWLSELISITAKALPHPQRRLQH